jgi:DNA-binding transcriptional MerR regulator
VKKVPFSKTKNTNLAFSHNFLRRSVLFCLGIGFITLLLANGVTKMQYQIGDFSRIARLSIKTLRYYHECGLLEPACIDQESGYRYYDESCLERVRMISELKELGFSLKDIKGILDQCEDDTELINHAIKKSLEINETIAHYHEMQKRLESFIKQIKQVQEIKILNINTEIIIKDIPDINRFHQI